MILYRQRQRQRDAAAQKAKQEAQAAKKLEDVLCTKFDETTDLVSSSTPVRVSNVSPAPPPLSRWRLSCLKCLLSVPVAEQCG
jgi:hypothetical protein